MFFPTFIKSLKFVLDKISQEFSRFTKNLVSNDKIKELLSNAQSQQQQQQQGGSGQTGGQFNASAAMSQLGATPLSVLQSIQQQAVAAAQQLNIPTIINATTAGSLKPPGATSSSTAAAIAVTPATITVVGPAPSAASAAKTSTIKLQDSFPAKSVDSVIQRPNTPQQQQQLSVSSGGGGGVGVVNNTNHQVQINNDSVSTAKRGSNFQSLPSKVNSFSVTLLLFKLCEIIIF